MSSKCPDPTLIPMNPEKVRDMAHKALMELLTIEEELYNNVVAHTLANMKEKKGGKWYGKLVPVSKAYAEEYAEKFVFQGGYFRYCPYYYKREAIREERTDLNKLMNASRYVTEGSDMWVSIGMAAMLNKYQ